MTLADFSEVATSDAIIPLSPITNRRHTSHKYSGRSWNTSINVDTDEKRETSSLLFRNTNTSSPLATLGFDFSKKSSSIVWHKKKLHWSKKMSEWDPADWRGGGLEAVWVEWANPFLMSIALSSPRCLIHPTVQFQAAHIMHSISVNEAHRDAGSGPPLSWTFNWMRWYQHDRAPADSIDFSLSKVAAVH